ncbi:hypothetical protein EMIHUDRAFT_228554 [Emiliania huxleyi CCMP1516]|uniref:WW domain-containing protein n=2 Tax=Emiliania huxleyi TaxID=2903 RepID=A0A0D3KFN4_EMIH1|nr:hypothetical protein EMIHUDRAFT_228554 [Emiliania huxleyi CCMP1516]EOD34569.1 hypothetical protein EMIHUDRAFT_228554 [Emiliania huxleyi CCMP1516]|eukprot:XP_005786998.1 hypothetical protein EMIHUDRAFT_228554 [Emiliania huxleyi CCMP1516]
MLGTWLAASAFALQPAVWTRPASLRTRHRCQLIAQDNNWYPAASGETYYYNADTGEAQWQVPPSAYSSSLVWRVLPHAGIRYEYAGCTLAMPLWRSDMADPSPYVSRLQCVVHGVQGSHLNLSQTSAQRHAMDRLLDNKAAKHVPPPTLWRAHESAPWMVLRKARPLGDDIGFDGTHALQHGEQISLDIREPEAAVFTVTCEEAGAGASVPQEDGYMHGYGERDF